MTLTMLSERRMKTVLDLEIELVCLGKSRLSNDSSLS